MRPSNDWNKIKTFYYVAKAGSFTKAGQVLNISQSSLSRTIRMLEYELKITLFMRIPKGLVLTKQGENLFYAAEKALGEFTRAEVAMREEEDEPQGTLKVATTMGMANVWIIPHLSDFITLYPKLRLSIIGDDEQLDLKSRQADVSIRPRINEQSDLIQEHVFTFHLKLYASSKYLDQYGTPQTPEDLNHHKMIVFGYDAINPYDNVNWPLKLGMPKGHLREPHLSINTSSGTREAAERGHGIVALAAEHPGLETSHFIEVLPHIEKPTVPIYYVYPEQLKDSKRVKALGHYLKERFKETKL